MPKAKTEKPKPSIVIIGAGRLGQALARALNAAGYDIYAVVSLRGYSAHTAVAPLKGTGRIPLAADELSQLPVASGLILIATPDDAIADTARRLAELARRTDFQGKRFKYYLGWVTVLHTSGALSSEVLAPLAAAGAQTGSIHPLVSISDPVTGANALRGAFYGLEGTPKAKRLAAQLVKDLGGISFSIDAEKKALYHAAAVMASPHLVALFDLATEMLANCGLSRKRSQEVLLPLLESTVNNLKAASPKDALTGTFARADLSTVRKHLSALSGKELAAALEVYRLLGLRSLELAAPLGLDPKKISEITKLLKGKTPASRRKRSGQ